MDYLLVGEFVKNFLAEYIPSVEFFLGLKIPDWTNRIKFLLPLEHNSRHNHVFMCS